MIDKASERMLLAIGSADSDHKHISVQSKTIEKNTKVKVKSFKGFKYTELDRIKMNRLFNNKLGDVPTHSDDELKNLLMRGCKVTLQCYMDHMMIDYQNKISEQQWEIEKQAERLSSITECVAYLEEKDAFNDHFYVRIEREGATSTCVIGKAPLDIFKKRVQYDMILVQTTEELGGIASIYYITMYRGSGDDKRLYIEHSYNTAFYMSRQYSQDEKMAEYEGPYVNLGMVDPYIMEEISLLMKVAKEQFGYPIEKLKRPKYQKTERWFIAKMSQNIFDGKGLAMHMVSCFKYSSYISDDYIKLINEFTKNYPEEAVWDVPTNQWPLVDFSDKEMKFTFNWLTKNGIYLSNDHGYLPVDLTKYFNCKYGNILRLKGILCGNETELILSWQVKKSSNYIGVNITQRVNQDLSALYNINICNADQYTIGNSIMEISKAIIVQHSSYPYHNYEELKEKSSLLRADLKDVLFILSDLIKILIMIEERPDRSRMVNKTKSSSNTNNANNNKKKNNNKKNNSSQPKDYVVSRILMPTKQAKQYVADKTSSGDRTFNYVMEEWEREGHWRTYKNGRSIYIESTTCHRHEPLTDKEIHVKL